MSVYGLSVGIVGLPNVGKSTLFNALLRRQIAAVAEYPYTTIEPNVGVVEVPDERLDKIADIVKIPKKVPAAIKFIDIAGLIKGAHQGEGLGNQFLAHIREVDAIVHIVRAFANSDVPHVAGKIDPASDIEVVNAELEVAGIKKPTIYVLNIGESQLSSESVKQLTGQINQLTNQPVNLISAKLEAELADLSEEDQKDYLLELGIEKSSLDQIIAQSYKLLDLVTFLTVAGGKQVQAWPVKVGTEMIEAAGMVHSDMERGFIAAEVIDWQKLTEVGSWLKARASGLIKTCGRNEKIVDGMVVEFKFSV